MVIKFIRFHSKMGVVYFLNCARGENSVTFINNEQITGKLSEQLTDKNMSISLSKKDTLCFFEALENSPEPNAKLINAVKKYRAHITCQPINHKERP